MVNDIRLYIDKEQVEFKTVPEILYNWTETDFSNPVTTKNSYSKTITIEGTKQNNKIFGHFWNLERYQLYGGNTGSDFNPSYKVPFTLYVNGNIFEKGYVKLQKVKENKGLLTYEIGLFGGLGSFLYNLSVNEDDGSVKTFNSLNFYVGDELADLNFNITKETVKEAWDNINNSSSKWNTINFAPTYSGIPEKFDANKVLINFKDISASTLTQSVFEDNVYYYPQGGSSSRTQGFAIGELSESLDAWQVKDLRSYMQLPVIRVKSIFDALQRPENSKGKFDDGYKVVLDKDFFNANNPYYENAFISLQKITTLTFTEDNSSEKIVIVGYSSTTKNVETVNGVTENTTVTFELPETLNTGNHKAHITFYLYNTVTRPGTAHPDVQYLLLQPAFIGPELLWYSENRTGVGVQLLATTADDTILTGSSIDWYTSVSYDGKYFSCADAISYETYKPKFNTSIINKKTGSFTFVQTAETGSIYSFTPIDIELDKIPSGVKKIVLDIQRCPEKSDSTETMYGNKLYQYGNRDTPELTFRGTFNISSLGSTEVSKGGAGEDNFYSNRYVKQNELLTTDYSISDWLISYCKMFGLYIHKDAVEDTIYIDTRNNYYQKNLVEDISALIDYSKDFSINPVYVSNKFYTLTNPIEKNKYSETYLANNGNDYGMKLINTGFEFDASRKELLNNFKIKTGIPINRQNIYNFKPLDGINPYVYNGFKYKLYANGDIDFEKTHEVEIDKKQIAKVYKNLFFNNDYPYYDSFYKMCFEDEGKAINSSNVFLFLNGFKDVTGDGYYLTDDINLMSKLNNNPCWIMTKSETSQDGVSVGISLSEIPLFSSYYAPEGNIMFSSNFGSPRELFVRGDELTNDDNATLYQQFYSYYYEDLFDINTKVVDCYVMPKNILTGENLRRFYWFNNGIWRLNKITDYSPVENRTVKCQFVKIQDMDAIGNDIPNKNGFITVTLNKYEIENEGETIQGRVTTNKNWTYDGCNYDDVTVTPENGFRSKNISVNVPFYSYSDTRTINLRFSVEGETITVPIIQKASSKYFKWIDTDTNYYSPLVPSSSTSFTASYETTYPNITFSGTTTFTDDGSNLTLTYPINTSSILKFYTVNAYYEDEIVGEIFVRQEAGESSYFRWMPEETSAVTTSNISSATTSLTKTFETNYSPIVVVCVNLVSNVTKTSNSITAEISSDLTETSGVVYVGYEDTTIGVWYLERNAPPPSIEFSIDGNFNNNNIYPGTFYVEVENQTHSDESVILSWVVEAQGGNLETKTFTAHEGDVIKFTLAASNYPATLYFEDVTSISEPIEVTLTMTATKIDFDASGVMERTNNRVSVNPEEEDI